MAKVVYNWQMSKFIDLTIWRFDNLPIWRFGDLTIWRLDGKAERAERIEKAGSFSEASVIVKGRYMLRIGRFANLLIFLTFVANSYFTIQKNGSIL